MTVRTWQWLKDVSSLAFRWIRSLKLLSRSTAWIRTHNILPSTLKWISTHKALACALLLLLCASSSYLLWFTPSQIARRELEKQGIHIVDFIPGNLIEKNDIKNIRYLLDVGVDVNKRPFTGEPPLYVAAQEGRTKIVRLLLGNGADVNIPKSEPSTRPPNHISTPLSIAAEKDHTNIVSILLKAGADVDRNDGKVVITPLHSAFRNKTYNPKIVKLLLDAGAKIDLLDGQNKTPLYRVGSNGHLEGIKLLLKIGAKVNTGDSPLFGAVPHGHTESVKLLLKAGANVNAQATDGSHPLYAAAEEKHLQAVKLLLESGADMNLPYNKKGATVPFYATCLGGNELVKLLIEAGWDVNERDDAASTLLFWAAYYNRAENAKVLINAGAEVNIHNETNATPLAYAVNRGFTAAARVLINAGASIHAPINKAGADVMQFAVIKGYESVVKLLIESGADVNNLLLPVGTHSLLGYAAHARHTGIVKALLQAGAIINRGHLHPLEMAAQNDHREIVQLLLNAREKVNCSGDALCAAVHKGNEEIAKMFISYGANVNMPDKCGKTPLQYAKEKGFTEITHLLRQAGARD